MEEHSMYGLIADLEMPYVACFRQPRSTSVLLTYPIPPFTTLVGLVANALGVHRAEYFEAIFWLQSNLLLNERPLHALERPSREMAKLLKMVGEPREELPPTSFPSSPMYKYLLVRPAYRMYLAAEDREIIADIAKALQDPARPLYLGQSDDMVDVSVRWVDKLQVRETEEAYGLVPGIHGGCQLLRLPLAFRSERSLQYTPVLSLPSTFPFAIPRQTLAFFSGEGVSLFRPMSPNRKVSDWEGSSWN